MMDESIVFERGGDGALYILNERWPRRIHIATDFLEIVRRGETIEPNASICIDGDTVVFTAKNGCATYRLALPCEGEHPEYALEQCMIQAVTIRFRNAEEIGTTMPIPEATD